MKLTFWGAAQQVTGSMFLLEFENEYRLLVDCGLDMEKKQMLTGEKIGLFPFEPSMIHAVVLTHAHIDHSGYIPNLLREGFEGKIYCTNPTFDLGRLLLTDAASLNQRKLKKFTKKLKSNPLLKKPEHIEELYLQRQVENALEHFVTLDFNRPARLARGIRLSLIPAGHLLGAAHVVLEFEEKGQTKKICFSGDIGRANYPLLQDPEPVPSVDYLVCESTYGNREHQSKESPEEVIYRIIQEACVEKAGKLIIPAFSVGRTQAMLFTLKRLQVAGKLPPIKVYTDSPLALQSTLVYQKYISYLNEEAQAFYRKHGPLFDFENLIYLENIKESRAVARSSETCIVISSSGMVQGGRIEYHVKENLQNPKATILMIGYAAEGTLGHDLINHAGQLSVKDKKIPIRAKVERIDTFSGHGDCHDLVRFFQRQSPQQLNKAFLVHGEAESMRDFSETLRGEGFEHIHLPQLGESFEL